MRQSGSRSVRCQFATTSAAVNGAPLWKRTPGRNANRRCVGSTCSQLSASAGSMPIVGDIATSAS